jgi:hypothetical protein
MKFSEALDIVNKNYVVGCADFYGKMPNDPWQRAHDMLDAALLTKDNTIITSATKQFASTLLSLIEKYKEFSGGQTPKLSIADAFYIADPEKVRTLHAAQRKVCIYCEAESDLSLVNKAGQAVIMCNNCKAQK